MGQEVEKDYFIPKSKLIFRDVKGMKVEWK